VRFGISLANVGSYADPNAAVELARVAEQHGWDAIFVWDHLAFAWGSSAADPWVTLAAIAAATEHVRLGTMVTPVARRRPQVLAQTVATLDLLSGGRVTFGAGLGGSASEFTKFGESSDARIRAQKLDEGLEILRALWSGGEVNHRGRHYIVDEVTLIPTPVQKEVPIWIGGNRLASRRRAARWDGWVADSADPRGAMVSPDELTRGVAQIRRSNDFDVAVLGRSDLAEPGAYADAGATWWLEGVNDRRGTRADMLRLVSAGPRS
jgi:probable F420-dependent oxidoreductase